MRRVLLALAAVLLASPPPPLARGTPAPAATAVLDASTLRNDFASPTPGAAVNSTSNTLAVTATASGATVAPGGPADAQTSPEPHPMEVMVDAPRRRFAAVRRCDVGYAWVRGLCRRLFGDGSSPHTA